MLIEEIYEYFSDKKSLFIFDNVENYKLLAPFLSKQISGNKPNVLITSRYSNWINIAQVIEINVFSESEAIELARKVLNIETTIYDEEIKELHRLVQGLPLALQQVFSYIKNRKIIEKFEIRDYIELFKDKSKALGLLNFDSLQYSNDPYTKTIYTTWDITLEKINQDPSGKIATELLDLMAYLCPDSIAANLFYSKFYDTEDLIKAFSLLKNYAMLNEASQENYFTIHRLVQKVTAIKLESTQELFENRSYKLHVLLKTAYKDEEISKHLVYFLFGMNSRKTLEPNSARQATFKKIFKGTQIYTKVNLIDFLDIARHTFERKIYLDFLKQFFVFYIKEADQIVTATALNYLKNLKDKGILTRLELRNILAIYNPYSEYKDYDPIKRLSNSVEKRDIQLTILVDIALFLKKEVYDCPSPRKTRSIDNCPLSLEEEKRVKKAISNKHIEMLDTIVKFTSTGLFTKDILSALLRGDFNSVAANFALLSGSIIAGKISNELLSAGEILSADEKILLEKEVFLQDKAALALLFDEDVIAVGKRKFLGNMLKVSSPFIARGISALFIFDLVKEINAYKKGDSFLLPDIISTGVIVGVDGIEAGIESAEILGLISEVSAFTGPIGEGISVVAWLGIEGYHVKEQLQEIEKHVHLTTKEAFFQGLRAFFSLKPSHYITIKAANNQLVQKAIDFLKQHTDIKRYVFPAWHETEGLHLKSEVYLNKQVNITLSETMPDDLNEGTLICLSRQKSSHFFISDRYKTDIYLCNEAIGVEYLADRTGDATLIALAQGDDKAVVLSNAPTYILVNNGTKQYKADNSLFILQGNAITGLLKGGKRTNGILMSDFHPHSSEYVLLDEQGILCGGNASFLVKTYHCDSKQKGLELKNIDYIYGRKDKKDILYINAPINFVDGYGGENKQNLDYTLVTNKSSKEIKFVLRNNSIILFDLDNKVDSASYHIPVSGTGTTVVQFPFSKPTQHRFFFDYTLHALIAISIENHQVNFTLSQQGIGRTKETFIVSLKDYSAQNHTQTVNNTALPINSYCSLQEGIGIRFFGKRIYAQQHTNTSLEEIIRDYSLAAHRLDMSFHIKHTNNNNETELVLIASNKHEILYTDPAVKNHLIGNHGDTSYVITSQENKTKPFPILDVTLYQTGETDLEGTDTLDLRSLIKTAKKICPEQTVFPRITESGSDLMISLMTYSDLVVSHCKNRSEPWSIATIKLNDTLDDEAWYQNVDVLLEEQHPMAIIKKENTVWDISPIPLVFGRNQQIIVFTEPDIKKETEIYLLKNIGNYTFLRHNGTDLIITNLLDSNVAKFDLCTILLSQFYKKAAMQEKVLSIPFTFIDQQLILSEHETKLNNAAEFDFWKLYWHLNNNANPINNSSLSIPGRSALALSERLSEDDPQRIKHNAARTRSRREAVSISYGKPRYYRSLPSIIDGNKDLPVNETALVVHKPKKYTIAIIIGLPLSAFFGGSLTAIINKLEKKYVSNSRYVSYGIQYGAKPVLLSSLSAVSNRFLLTYSSILEFENGWKSFNSSLNSHDLEFENGWRSFVSCMGLNYFGFLIAQPIDQLFVEKVSNKWLAFFLQTLTWIFFWNPSLFASEEFALQTSLLLMTACFNGMAYKIGERMTQSIIDYGCGFSKANQTTSDTKQTDVEISLLSETAVAMPMNAEGNFSQQKNKYYPNYFFFKHKPNTEGMDDKTKKEGRRCVRNCAL